MMQSIVNVKVRVNDLERIRYEAMVRGDTTALAPMFSDDLVYSHSDGNSDTKVSLLEKIQTGYLDYQEIESHSSKTMIIGGTAVITGRMVAEVRVDGVTRRLNNRTLSVWTLYEDSWLFLAFQPTVLNKK